MRPISIDACRSQFFPVYAIGLLMCYWHNSLVKLPSTDRLHHLSNNLNHVSATWRWNEDGIAEGIFPSLVSIAEVPFLVNFAVEHTNMPRMRLFCLVKQEPCYQTPWQLFQSDLEIRLSFSLSKLDTVKPGSKHRPQILLVAHVQEEIRCRKAYRKPSWLAVDYAKSETTRTGKAKYSKLPLFSNLFLSASRINTNPAHVLLSHAIQPNESHKSAQCKATVETARNKLCVILGVLT